MDWTEEEEHLLLDYLRDEDNNKRFLKINAERAKAFSDCAVFLTRESEQRRQFAAEDVKEFCLYLVKDRYKLNSSNLSHLFRIGIFFHREDGSCDIFTRDECRKLSEEDSAGEEGRLILGEAPSLALRDFESVTRRGARYKSRSSETEDSKNSSSNARKRQRSGHPKSMDESKPLSVPDGQKWIVDLPGGLNHLVFKYQHMDGAEIRRKFAKLENDIMVAADGLPPQNKSKISLNRTHRYGPDDFRLIKSIPIANIIQRWKSGVHFQVARALVGRAVFQWVFEEGVADSGAYGNPSKDAVEAVWTIKCQQYDMRMLHPLHTMLKDAYFWQTTETKFLDSFLPKRSREFAGRLSSLLGTLLKIEVPHCLVEHDSEQERRKDCSSWCCQVEAIFFDALDLCIKLRQRDQHTVFRWPATNDRFDGAFMQDEGESIAHQPSNLMVKVTYMPAVVDQRDSEDPNAIDGGVWYKAVVRLASAPPQPEMARSASPNVSPDQEAGL